MAIISNSIRSTTGRSNVGGAGNTGSRNSMPAGNSLGVSEGQVVKGTVVDVHGNEITIQRDDGTTFKGKLADASQYSIGQNAAFQVTSASAKTILMKALSDAYILSSDDTIFKALDEAGLPKSPRNFEVVRSLLSTQQSISKESIVNALRLCANYPDSSVDSVLTMKYLSLPMSKENVMQFEQYQNKTHQLLNKMDALANSINEVLNLVGKQAPNASANVGMQFLNMALETSEFLDPPAVQQGFDTSAAAPGQILIAAAMPDGTPLPKGNLLVNGQLIAAELIEGEIVPTEGTELPEDLKTLIKNTPKENITLLGNISEEAPQNLQAASEVSKNLAEQVFIKGQIGNTLPSETLREFQSVLKELPLSEQLQQDIQNGTAATKDVLSAIRNLLPSLPPDVSGKLLSSPGFQALLKEQLLSGWTISPEAFKEAENVERLYEKLERQLDTVTKFSETVSSQKAFSDMGNAAGNMQNNLNFMKTLNENLAYMQLPIKLSEENAHGDLYVMTKKDALKKHPDKLHILLHLELDHLGTLDIHVEKEKSNVKTNFYVDDKKTIRLIEKNIELLSDALIDQGYLLTNETHLHEKEIDVVKDFIAMDHPIGDMKRYNFDLRA